MELRVVTHLDKWELLDRYNNKYLQLLVDTDKGIVYHVKSYKRHVQAVSELLGMPIHSLNQDNAGHLVSAYIEIVDDKVKNIMVGSSSFELGAHIKHTSKQLAIAQALINRIVKESRQLKEVA